MRYDSPKSIVSEVKKLKSEKVMQFLVLYFHETFICYRGCFNLSCYISTKVQNFFFLRGLKFGEVGTREFLSKSPVVGRISIFHAKLRVFRGGFSIFWSFF